MSNTTRRTESCEVRESGELTDDKLAAVVGGEKNELNLARHDFKNGDYERASFAHLTAGMADIKTGSKNRETGTSLPSDSLPDYRGVEGA